MHLGILVNLGVLNEVCHVSDHPRWAKILIFIAKTSGDAKKAMEL